MHFKRSLVKTNIKDDGKGFDVNKTVSSKSGLRGFGLLTMKERLELVNGSFDIQSSPGEGTEITIEIPLNHSQA